jgi:hypothetical protein
MGRAAKFCVAAVDVGGAAATVGCGEGDEGRAPAPDVLAAGSVAQIKERKGDP